MFGKQQNILMISIGFIILLNYTPQIIAYTSLSDTSIVADTQPHDVTISTNEENIIENTRQPPAKPIEMVNLEFGGSLAAASDADSALNSPNAEVLVLDTVSNAPGLTYTSGTPRTYMGDPFNAADPGVQLQISKIDFYMVSTIAQTFTNGLCLRIQFWENFNGASSPVFSTPVGATQLFLVPGPVTLNANTYYIIIGTFPTPLAFANITNNGFTINYQGDNGAGCVNTDNLTSLIRYVDEPAEVPIAVGNIPLPAPDLGYYRNASGLTNFNFLSSDLRAITNTNSNGLAIKLYAEVGTVTPTPTNTPTNTPTPTPSNTPVAPTFTNTPTPTNTSTPTNTPTSTPTNTLTPTPTYTPTPTNTPALNPTNTPTPTFTATPTVSATPDPRTFLPAVMVVPNETPLPPTKTPTATSTPTNTPTATPTNTPTLTPTPPPLPQLKLYVRPNGMLSQNPETALYQAFFYPGTVHDWTYTLDGDIPGSTYEFSLMLGSLSTTDFSVSLLVDGQTLASTPFTATSDTYERFTMTVTGIDPTTSTGDILTLRVAHASGGNGGLLSGPPSQGIDSYITLPEPQ